MVKPTTSLDVSVLLADVIDAKTVTRQLDIYKAKGKREAIIKPKRRLRSTVWLRIQKWVKSLSGKWHPKEQLWTIPLKIVQE